MLVDLSNNHSKRRIWHFGYKYILLSAYCYLALKAFHSFRKVYVCDKDIEITRASIFPNFRIKVKPYKLFLFLYNQDNVQVSFRQLLTMLAVFDCVFITTVSVSFSLPQLSTYWKVASLKHMNSVIISNWHKNQLLFQTQVWVHPRVFPWLFPFIQISLTGSTW